MKCIGQCIARQVACIKQPVMARERAVPCSPAEAAGGKEAAGLTSEREWKAATGAAKVGRWLAAYVSFVPPVTLLEKLLLLRSVPAERTAIGRGHVTQPVSGQNTDSARTVLMLLVKCHVQDVAL